MMMLKNLALTAAAFMALTFAPLASAQEQEVSEGQLEQARLLVELNNADSIYKTILGALGRDTVKLFVQTNPDLETEIKASVDKISKELEERVSTLRDEIIRIFAQTFTEEELEEIIAFMQTETGKKFIANQGELNERVLEAAVVWGDILSEQMVSKVREDMKAKGHQF